MEEKNNQNINYPIFVDLSIRLVKNGFNYIKMVDLGEVEGQCAECGHPIRYEFWYSDKQTGEEYSYGSECNYKLYVLLHWHDQIDIEDVEDKQLQRAGKWLWVLYRDKLISRMKDNEKIPQPKDYIKEREEVDDEIISYEETGGDEETTAYDEISVDSGVIKNYKKLADDMKRLVLKVRNRIKEVDKKKDQLKRKIIEGKMFLERHGINLEICSEKEKKFLSTVYNLEKKGWVLSEKQQKWLEDIEKRSKNNSNGTDSKIKNLLTELKSKSNLYNATEWELDFINSVVSQFNEGRKLSDKQLNIIYKLESKVLTDKSYIKKDTNEIKSNSMKLVDKIQEFNVKPIIEQEKNIDEIETMDINGIDVKLTEKYIDKKTKTWVIHQQFGLWTQGKIIAVKKETEKAILCNLELEKVQNKIKNNVWIPLVQLEETITL